jgi:hypothetical protein
VAIPVKEGTYPKKAKRQLFRVEAIDLKENLGAFEKGIL